MSVTLREFPVAELRNQFPALTRQVGGRPAIFLDGPAGTQVPVRVADAMSHYLLNTNANHGGVFPTSIESDRVLNVAHRVFADFVNTSDPCELVFGQNMTSLTFAFSRAISRTWAVGDEIVVTRLDHDANISPWVLAARDSGVDVKFVSFDPEDGQLSMTEMRNAIGPKTRLVAVGCASNATGGINPVREIAELAHKHQAFVYLDAVHFAPHGLIDVQAWDCDFVAFSAYKFFGPHLGTVWGRRDLLESLEAYKVEPAPNGLPGKWMTGTQSFESIVGGAEAIEYLVSIADHLSDENSTGSRRELLEIAYQGIQNYERQLSRRFIDGVLGLGGYQIHGITDLKQLEKRFPTFSITSEKLTSPELARKLSDHGIFAWHGHYYALQFSKQMGFEPEGMVRIGMLHYNTFEEVERTIDVLERLLN